MKKDKSTKPELSKEEYLKSFFNGAKDELEAYIVSNDQLAADEEPEQADKEHRVFLIPIMVQIHLRTSIMMEVIIINL